MEQLNNIDVVILIGFAISMLVAFIRGFVKEMLSITGLVLFVLLSIYAIPMAMPIATKYIKSEFMAQVATVLLIMGIFYTFWIISTDKIIRRIRKSTLSFMDRLFGVVFGFLRAFVILVFSFLVAKTVMPEEVEENGTFAKSKYFIMAGEYSNIVEELLPKDYIQDTMLTLDKFNQPSKEDEIEKKDEITDSSDQEQMNQMFELLVNPKVQKVINKQDDDTSYNKSETTNLDKLIEVVSD